MYDRSFQATNIKHVINDLLKSETPLTISAIYQKLATKIKETEGDYSDASSLRRYWKRIILTTAVTMEASVHIDNDEEATFVRIINARNKSNSSINNNNNGANSNRNNNSNNNNNNGANSNRNNSSNNSNNSNNNKDSPISAAIESSSSSSSSSSRPSSSSSSSSPRLISEADKERIKAMYNAIPTSDHWVLSTGKNVHETMLAVALERNHEHLTHSMILDPFDTVWTNQFSLKERQEILNFAPKSLPAFPPSLQQHLDSYDAATTPADLYFQAKKKSFHPIDQHDDEWIQEAMIFYAKQFMLNKEVDIGGISEADLLLKLWRPLYDIFIGTGITATAGDTTSKSSAQRSNMYRTLEDKKKIGARLDLIFRCQQLEHGGVEIGRHTLTESDTKFMVDGYLKLPKSLKDMLSVLLSRCPEKRNQFRTTGMVIMGSNMQLVSIDIPFGNICRLTKTRLLHFPLAFENFNHDIKPILTLFWKTYQAITINTQLLTHSNPSQDIDTLTIIPSLPLPPSFTPTTTAKDTTTTTKKRKSLNT